MSKKRTDYTPRTLTGRKQKNKIHPIATQLSGLFVDALMGNPSLPNTVWCIDLARAAIGWELIAHAERKTDLFVQNKIIQKIERDKGVRIR